MPRPALVGRARELARLDGACAAARAGRGSLVLVTGEPGIGKTSLVEAAIEAARPEPAALWGSCRDGTGVPGLWPWGEIVRSAREHGLFTGEGDVLIEHPVSTLGAGPDRLRLFDALSRGLRRLADDHSVVVVLDDLQWADAGSLRLLSFLAADLARSRLLVVATLRDGPDVGADDAADDNADDRASVSEALARVVSQATTVSLGPLTEDEVAHLIRRIVPERATAERVGALYRRCGGNPLLVREVSQAADPERLPAGVRDLIRDRLARLPRDAVECSNWPPSLGEVMILRRAGGSRRPPSPARSTPPSPRAACNRRARRPLHPRPVPRGALPRPDSLTRANLRPDRQALEALVAPGAGRRRTSPGTRCRRLAGDPAQPLPYLGGRRRAAARLAFGRPWGTCPRAPGWRAWPGSPRCGGPCPRPPTPTGAGDLNEARAGYLDAADDARRAGDADGLARAALGLHAVGSETWPPPRRSGLLEEAPLRTAPRRRGLVTSAPAGVPRWRARWPRWPRSACTDPRCRARARGRAGAVAYRPAGRVSGRSCPMAHDARGGRGSAARRLGDPEEVAAIGDRRRLLAWQGCFGRFVALLEARRPRAYAS
jgi:hypothetical protein